MDGIVGIYGPDDEELVSKAFLATGACQHRGKASTGLAVGNSKGIYVYKGLGRIAEVIDRDIARPFRTCRPWPPSAISDTPSGEFLKKSMWSPSRFGRKIAQR